MKVKPVEPGDIVDVIAPASRCSPKELQNSLRFVMSLGLRPRMHGRLFAREKLIFANSDQERLIQLKKALYAPDSRMVWCVRGGYGAIRLMPEILKWKKPSQPKIFLGYSDITTLHAHLNQKWKWPTIHGPLLERAGSGRMDAKEKKTLLGLIFGSLNEVRFESLQPLNKAARKSGVIRATVHGGNMATLQSSLGTPAAFKPQKQILFLEDTGEWPHRVDRMLTQFQQAGWFNGVKAVVFGHFLLNDRKARRGLWQEVIPRFAQSVKIPVLKGLPVGHDPKVQIPLPFNTTAVLKTGSAPELRVQSGIISQ